MLASYFQEEMSTWEIFRLKPDQVGINREVVGVRNVNRFKVTGTKVLTIKDIINPER